MDYGAGCSKASKHSRQEARYLQLLLAGLQLQLLMASEAGDLIGLKA